MAAPDYTSCVERNSYRDPGFPSGNFFSTIAAVILQGGFDLLLKVCDYILRGKLVCLGGDRCAIGRVASFETVDDKSGFEKLDNDFSINLALCPYPLSGLKVGIGNRRSNYESAAGKSHQGDLLREQSGMPDPREDPSDKDPAVTDTGRFVGTFVKIHTILSLGSPIPEKIANESDSQTWHLPILHAEIEGDRAAVVCAAANVLWGPVHNTVCKIPIIGGLLCTIITIFAWPVIVAILAALTAAWAAGSDDNRDFDGGGDLKADDLVLIHGRWVYDAGHNGWNELHPVKHIQKIPDRAVCEGSDFEEKYNRWCEQVAKIPGGRDPETGGPPKGSSDSQTATWNEQTKPENRWFFHPLVDGCQPIEHRPDNMDIK